MSQSLRDSHTGSTAAESGWMNGCMSEVLRSSFSYQLAVGRTISERSEEHTSELQSLMRISYAVFCLKKKINHYMCNKIDNRTSKTAENKKYSNRNMTN